MWTYYIDADFIDTGFIDAEHNHSAAYYKNWPNYTRPEYTSPSVAVICHYHNMTGKMTLINTEPSVVLLA